MPAHIADIFRDKRSNVVI